MDNIFPQIINIMDQQQYIAIENKHFSLNINFSISIYYYKQY